MEEEKRNVGFDHSKTSIEAQQGEKKMRKKKRYEVWFKIYFDL
jgi:hypothetical protein